MKLQDLVLRAASRTPDAVAVRGPDGQATYRELSALANRIARALSSLGVRRGDRVGIWLDKSVRAVATMQGVLRAGAAYLPIDPASPALRARAILRDCEARALVTSGARAAALRAGEEEGPACLCVDSDAYGMGWEALDALSPAPLADAGQTPGDLAYILYTSGSTGRPKGVCISHENALSFIHWAAGELGATAADRFANHAPFHFDLSVLDLYAAFAAGAQVAIVPDGASFAPKRLVEFLVREGITIWYSVPSALVLMMEHGGLLELPGLPLRALLFAGEAFPVKHLKRLRERFPDLRYLNLYGPTETNVCTFFDLTDLRGGPGEGIPIGRACCGNRVWAARADGSAASPGEEGELFVEGPTVMLGYWGQALHGERPYATGDIVRHLGDGTFHLVGRRDHLVKIRGNRVELGEIEAALLDHPEVLEAVVVVRGTGLDARLVAFLSARSDLPLLAIKKHCAERLPRYMIVDDARTLPALPRTANGKVDRAALASGSTLADTPMRPPTE